MNIKQFLIVMASLCICVQASAQTAAESIRTAVRQLVATYPEARLQDVYKSFY